MIKFTVCGNENLYHCQIHLIYILQVSCEYVIGYLVSSLGKKNFFLHRVVTIITQSVDLESFQF